MTTMPTPDWSVAALAKLAVLGLLLLFAAIADLRRHRIPNWLNVTALIAGVLLSGVSAPLLSADSLALSLTGAAIAFALFILLYALRLMGAGDVKLLTAIGAFVGPVDILGVALTSFVAGGLLGIALALHARVLGQVLANARQMLHASIFAMVDRGQMLASARSQTVATRMPFGVAIAVGTFAWLAIVRFPTA